MSRGYFTDLAGALGSAWNRFWFTPADPLPCACLRIAVGLVAIGHFLTLGIDLDRWYTADGFLPLATVRSLTEVRLADGTLLPNYHWSYLNYLSTPGQLWIAHIAAIAAAALFTVGLLTRVSGALTAAAVLSYVHRAPMIAGHVEPVLGFLLIYLTIAPSGSYFAIDRWLALRRNGGAAELQPSLWANLGLRLIQVHTAMFFLMMGLTKMYGDAWWNGIAIWNLLAQTQSRPLDLTFLQRSGQVGEYFVNFWTHAVVYYELAFPILIWNRHARPLLLGLGVVLWISLILASGLVLFGLTMIVATAAFVPAEWYRAWLSRPAVHAAGKLQVAT
jgi:hypothetical protein